MRSWPRCSAGFWGIRVSIVISLAGMAVGCGSGGTPAAPRTASAATPSVVLVVMDTLRADRIDAVRNGAPVMPFLSKLAASGTRYTHAMSPCSWTKPAMASVFTGLYPQEHKVIYSAHQIDGAVVPSDMLSKDFTTLPERLSEAGYHTWGFQTNTNLTAAHGFAQGYAFGDYIYQSNATATEVTDAALKQLPSLNPPFFMYTHYVDPHAPYNPDVRYQDALGPEPKLPPYDRELLADDERFMAYYGDQVRTMLGLQAEDTIPDLSEAGKAAVVHRYDLECYAMDREIERLVETVQAREPNSIFVFLSDHGEEFWERDGMGHGTTLHQEQVHVPYFVAGAGVPQATIEETVSTLCLTDVVFSLLDVAAEEETGTPGGEVEQRPVYSFSRGTWPEMGVDANALYDAGYSYLQERRLDKPVMYYLPEDPGEQQDLTAAQPDMAAQMKRTLGAHLGAVGGGGPGETTLLDDDALEALESMGYLD